MKALIGGLRTFNLVTPASSEILPELHDLKDDNLQGLTPEAVAALAQQLLQRLRRQDSEIRFNEARI